MAYYNTDTLQDLSLRTERYDPFFSGGQTPGKLRIKEEQRRKAQQRGFAHFQPSGNNPARKSAPPAQQHPATQQISTSQLQAEATQAQGSQNVQTASFGGTQTGKGVLYVLGGAVALVGIIGLAYLIKQGRKTSPMIIPEA